MLWLMVLSIFLLRSGEFFYSLSLRDTDKVVFIGNSAQAKIEGVEIFQFPDNFMQVPIGGIFLFEGEIVPNGYEVFEEIEAPQGLRYIRKVR